MKGYKRDIFDRDIYFKALCSKDCVFLKKILLIFQQLFFFLELVFRAAVKTFKKVIKYVCIYRIRTLH